MPDLVAYRAHVDVTARGQRTKAGDLIYLPRSAPIIAMLESGNAIERAPEFDDLAPQEE